MQEAARRHTLQYLPECCRSRSCISSWLTTGRRLRHQTLPDTAVCSWSQSRRKASRRVDKHAPVTGESCALSCSAVTGLWQLPTCSLLGSLLVLQAAPAFAAGPQNLSSSLQSSTSAISNLLGNSLGDEDADPWTLYGISKKKYAIEKRDGEKILSRRKGFTVDTCSSGIAANQETPAFQGASTSEKLAMLDWQSCSHAEAPDLKSACVQTCAEACANSMREYEDRSLRVSGLHMSTTDGDRMKRSCNRQCPYQCNKPGQQYGFVIPFRR